MGKQNIVTCDVNRCEAQVQDEPAKLIHWVRVQVVATDSMPFEQVLVNSGADRERLERGRRL